MKATKSSLKPASSPKLPPQEAAPKPPTAQPPSHHKGMDDKAERRRKHQRVASDPGPGLASPLPQATAPHRAPVHSALKTATHCQAHRAPPAGAHGHAQGHARLVPSSFPNEMGQVPDGACRPHTVKHVHFAENVHQVQRRAQGQVQRQGQGQGPPSAAADAARQQVGGAPTGIAAAAVPPAPPSDGLRRGARGEDGCGTAGSRTRVVFDDGGGSFLAALLADAAAVQHSQPSGSGRAVTDGGAGAGAAGDGAGAGVGSIKKVAEKKSLRMSALLWRPSAVGADDDDDVLDSNGSSSNGSSDEDTSSDGLESLTDDSSNSSASESSTNDGESGGGSGSSGNEGSGGSDSSGGHESSGSSSSDGIDRSSSEESHGVASDSPGDESDDDDSLMGSGDGTAAAVNNPPVPSPPLTIPRTNDQIEPGRQGSQGGEDSAAAAATEVEDDDEDNHSRERPGGHDGTAGDLAADAAAAARAAARTARAAGRRRRRGSGDDGDGPNRSRKRFASRRWLSSYHKDLYDICRHLGLPPQPQRPTRLFLRPGETQLPFVDMIRTRTAELWNARFAATTYLAALEDEQIRHGRLIQRRRPGPLATWMELDDAGDTELKTSRALTAGAPLPPPPLPPPADAAAGGWTAPLPPPKQQQLAGAASRARLGAGMPLLDGAPALWGPQGPAGAVTVGGWHWPYGAGAEAPYDSTEERLGREAADWSRSAGDAAAVGADGAERDGVAPFGFRIRRRLVERGAEVSVAEARERVARLYHTGSISSRTSSGSSSMSSDGESSSGSDGGEAAAVCSSSSSSDGLEQDEEDKAEKKAGNKKPSRYGVIMAGARVESRRQQQRRQQQQQRAQARVRQVDELLAVPDPDCDEGVDPADEIQLEPASSAFFDEYFWEHVRTVRKQYDYAARDGAAASGPRRAGSESSRLRRRQQLWRFAHWEIALQCAHPGCGALKLIHMPAVVPPDLTPEQLAASGLRVWVVRPAGQRGEHNHAAPGGGGGMLSESSSERPLSELHRLVPSELPVDIPLAASMPLPLPLLSLQQQQLAGGGYSGAPPWAAAAAAAASCPLPPGRRAAAAVWLLEPPPPPVWTCRGLVWRKMGQWQQPGGGPCLGRCGAINRATRAAAAVVPAGAGAGANTTVGGQTVTTTPGVAVVADPDPDPHLYPDLLISTGRWRTSGSHSCAFCGARRPDGPRGWLRQLVANALDRHNPASVTPRQVYTHVLKTTTNLTMGITAGSTAAAAAATSAAGHPTAFSLREVAADAFVVLMQRAARALLEPHLPPIPPPPPSAANRLAAAAAGDLAATTAAAPTTSAGPLMAAVISSEAWSWPGLHLMQPTPPAAAAAAAAAAGRPPAAARRTVKKAARPQKGVLPEPDAAAMVMTEAECGLDLQLAAGVWAGGGGGGRSQVVDVEEVGDWHLPLAFRQLQRAAGGAASAHLATPGVPGVPAAASPPPADPAAAIVAATAAAQASAPASRAAAAVEAVSHMLMGLMGSLEWPLDLRDPQKPKGSGSAALLGDPYGSPSGSANNDNDHVSKTSAAHQAQEQFPAAPKTIKRAIFGDGRCGGDGTPGGGDGGEGPYNAWARGPSVDAGAGGAQAKDKQARFAFRFGHESGSGSGSREALEVLEVLQTELETSCPQVAKLLVPLDISLPLKAPAPAGRRPVAAAATAAAAAGGVGAAAAAVVGGSTDAAPSTLAAAAGRGGAPLAWDGPGELRPTLELCGPAVRLHDTDTDGVNDHPIGMPYMVSELGKRRRLSPSVILPIKSLLEERLKVAAPPPQRLPDAVAGVVSEVGGGGGAGGAGSGCNCAQSHGDSNSSDGANLVYKLGSREWFLHCLRQQLHPECEIFGGPVGQWAGLHLHVTGRLRWLPIAAQQQTMSEAVAAAALQTSAAAASPEELAAALHGAVHASLRRRRRRNGGTTQLCNVPAAASGARPGEAVSALDAAAAAQLDLLSPSLMARPAHPRIAAAAIATATGLGIAAATAPAAAPMPAAAAIYGAAIALSSGAAAVPALRPAFHRRQLPRSTVSQVVQYTIAWESRWRHTHLASKHGHRNDDSRHDRNHDHYHHHGHHHRQQQQHPEWALDGLPMGDPWDVTGIAAMQRCGNNGGGGGEEDGRAAANGVDRVAAIGCGSYSGRCLTQRMLQAAKHTAASGANSGAAAGGVGAAAGGYPWRVWRALVGAGAGGAAAADQPPQAGGPGPEEDFLEPETDGGNKKTELPRDGDRDGWEGTRAEGRSQLGHVDTAKTVPGSAAAAADGRSGGGGGAAVAGAASDLHALPPRLVMLMETARRCAIREDIVARAAARFAAAMQTAGASMPTLRAVAAQLPSERAPADEEPRQDLRLGPAAGGGGAHG